MQIYAKITNRLPVCKKNILYCAKQKNVQIAYVNVYWDTNIWDSYYTIVSIRYQWMKQMQLVIN